MPSSPSSPAPGGAPPSRAARLVEAHLFRSAAPVPEEALAALLPPGGDLAAALAEVEAFCRGRAVELVRLEAGWVLRVRPADLAAAAAPPVEDAARLSPAALETLAIVAMHQPVTLPDLERLRGGRGTRSTLESLVAAGLVETRGRLRATGRAAAYVTSPLFLDVFGLESLADLPSPEEVVLMLRD